ncbi:MAG: hypothetical protein HYV35_01160 [Lentisphaerae bacterium]|nr:hypothetical protein [Lentisphaerota bacterium]
MKHLIKITIIVSLAALALSQETNAPRAAAADYKPQTTCPVMEGKRIEKMFYVDYEGYRIYLCCKPCVKAARKDPEKYLKILQAQGVTLEKAETNAAAAKR